jgi:hypothetical protein
VQIRFAIAPCAKCRALPTPSIQAAASLVLPSRAAGTWFVAADLALWRERRRCSCRENGRGFALGDPPVVEGDDPSRDHGWRLLRHLRDFVLRNVLIPARDVDEHQHAAHGDGNIAAGVEEAVPGCRAQIDGSGEALDPDLPERVPIAWIDGKQRTVARGIPHQGQNNIVVMIHHETHDAVGVVEIVEGRFPILLVQAPHDRKPIPGSDQLGTHEQAGDQAVELLDQHDVLTQCEQFVFKLLATTR